MFEKIRENKALKIIGKVLYYILFVLVIILLLIVVVQRVTKNNISIGGIRIFNIVTESMVPKYEVGDILVAKSVDPSQIKVGDDVVYLGNKDTFVGKVVTHQVIAINEENGKYTFHTKGIANDIEDPEVSEDQIYGVIVYKTHILSFSAKISNNLQLFFFLIFIPAALLIVIKIFNIIREKDDDEEEDKPEDKN